MNSINVTVLTPWFMAPLFERGVACVVLAAVSLAGPSRPGAAWIAAGGALHFLGKHRGDDRLQRASQRRAAAVDAAGPAGARLWASYLIGWTAWDHVRTVTALLAVALPTIGFRRS
jgi:uncharacterized membrane protein